MNFDFALQINPHLEKLEFAKALQIAEKELKKIPLSEFHAVIGHSLIPLADGLASWIDDFYKKASKKFTVKAFYFEMNEFDINTDAWEIDGFAYAKDGRLDPDDMGWLVDFQTDTRTETGSIVFDDYEKLQRAFANINPETKELKAARDWCEQIIITRFMELMRAIHVKAKEKKLGWASIPLYFTEHEYDFIVKSEN